MLSQLCKVFPLLKVLREKAGVDQLRSDLTAGITIAFLAIPQGMAYAVIANLHPIYGLFAATVAAITAGFFISSRHVITGPTATVSIIVAGILFNVDLPPTTAVFYLTVLVGILQILFYLINLGNLARFVSNAVVTGLVIGSGLVIVGDQLLSLLGVTGVNSSYFFLRFYRSLTKLFRNPGGLDVYALAIGVATVVLVGSLRRWNRRFPASLTVLVGSALLVRWLAPPAESIKLVGTMPSAIPVPVSPAELSLGVIEKLFPGAVALALFSSVQCVSISKSVAARSGDSVNENREILSQGLANLGSGIFGGLPVAASFSRSFFNQVLGARTQLSGLLSGVLVAGLTIVGAPVISYVPIPVLTGIIVVIVSEVIDLDTVGSIWLATKRDRISFLSTFLGVIFLKLDYAIYLGVAVSIIFHLRESTRLDLKEYILDENGEIKNITSSSQRIDPRIVLVDISGEAFFGSADQIQQRVDDICDNSDELQVIILRMKNAANFDITGAQALKSVAEGLRDRGKTLILCGTTPKIRDVLKRADISDVIGEDKILVAQRSLLESTRQAFERAREHIEEVLEGEKDREEEEPELDTTMEELEEENGDQDQQDPLPREKHTVYTPDDELEADREE